MTIGGVPIDINGIGVVGLVALFGLALARGWLFTKRQYDDVVHDRNEWRTAHRISEAARLESGEHQRTVTETASTMNQLMHELQERLHRAKLRDIDNGDHT